MKVEALTKTYNGHVVLSLPEFQLEPGTVTAVIGANGSGKTTLARLLAGCEKADDPDWSPPAVPTGYMPQKSFPFRMSLQRNIALNGRDPARAARLTEALGLTGLLRQPARKLSGGETARMALARLLMGDYALLLLDEPTAAMDVESTLAAEELIRGYVKTQRCAALLVTHSIQQARRCAGRIVFLRAGRLIEQGETEDLLLCPQEADTRRFLEFYGLQ